MHDRNRNSQPNQIPEEIQDVLKNLEIFRKSALQWVKNMLFYDEIRLKDIPYEIRTSSLTPYVMALRISRGVSCKRYIKDLQILCRDIHRMNDNNPMKAQLLNKLVDAMNFHDFQEEQEFVNFEKDVYEDVLRGLRETKCAAQ